MKSEIILDEVIHQPIRTKIIALIINSGACDYTTVKNTLNLSDGHMTTHMRVLIANEYIKMKKEFINNKPKTTYFITEIGKQKFNEYLNNLKKIIEG